MDGPDRDEDQRAGGATPRVPDREELLGLDADAWAQVLVHARTALNSLEDEQLTQRLKRLRASPTSRLAAGRTRRELAGVIARGGPLWLALHERLGEAELPGRLDWLVSGEPAPRPAPSEQPEDQQQERADRVAELRDELDRERQRSRRLREELDGAIQRADGAQARAETLEDKLEQARRRVADRRRRVEELEQELEEARQDRADAVERERRRQDRRIEELEAELTARRRREQERARQRRAEERRREEAHEQAAANDGGQRAPSGRGGPVATPGRPCRLPEGVARETAEGAAALLAAVERVLIDGYNVTKSQRPDLDLEDQRSWMVRLAQRIATRFDVDPHVVFDGATGVGDYAGIHRAVDVGFSAQGVTADDEIVFLVEAAEPDEPLLVVTDDRELQERVAERGVDVVGTGPLVWAAG